MNRMKCPDAIDLMAFFDAEPMADNSDEGIVFVVEDASGMRLHLVMDEVAAAISISLYFAEKNILSFSSEGLVSVSLDERMQVLRARISSGQVDGKIEVSIKPYISICSGLLSNLNHA